MSSNRFRDKTSEIHYIIDNCDLLRSENVFIKEQDSESIDNVIEIISLFTSMWLQPLIDYQQTTENWLNKALPRYIIPKVLDNVSAANNFVLLNSTHS